MSVSGRNLDSLFPICFFFPYCWQRFFLTQSLLSAGKSSQLYSHNLLVLFEQSHLQRKNNSLSFSSHCSERLKPRYETMTKLHLCSLFRHHGGWRGNLWRSLRRKFAVSVKIPHAKGCRRCSAGKRWLALAVSGGTPLTMLTVLTPSEEPVHGQHVPLRCCPIRRGPTALVWASAKIHAPKGLYTVDETNTAFK